MSSAKHLGLSVKDNASEHKTHHILTVDEKFKDSIIILNVIGGENIIPGDTIKTEEYVGETVTIFDVVIDEGTHDIVTINEKAQDNLTSLNHRRTYT